MVVYLIIIVFFFAGLFIVGYDFLKADMVYMSLYLILIAVVYMIFAIKLVFCFYKIYRSFNRSFDGQFQSETKQILFYIALFAFVFALASTGPLLLLVDDP